MGKFNPNNIECWFSRLVQRKGEDYIKSGKLLEKEVTRNVDRIIDDIINAKIDYAKYGYAIVYPPIFDTLMSYCNAKLCVLTAENYSLMYVNAALSKGEINISPMNTMPMWDSDRKKSELQNDYKICNATITPGMKININTAIGEVVKDIQKYNIVLQYLQRVKYTSNVFELQVVPQILKQYLRSNPSVF